ncbi:hypothetical protein [Hymenobacter psychrophilus]|uniref:Uncharacterized protein n=1 Tax=Hymenobacter psychrophilus TaxID=651662 RepID=A0A1H3P4Q6_9BACT|nr:hypothetical protein [Hymenobacter psychrophilus]SDY96097.1 hypothetical protein SAMN04488069_1226 [Hymenobacter psychrophilus]
MHHLGMSYRTIKPREANPSTRTTGELLLVADLLNERVQDIMAIVLAQVQAGNYPPAGTD